MPQILCSFVSPLLPALVLYKYSLLYHFIPLDIKLLVHITVALYFLSAQFNICR